MGVPNGAQLRSAASTEIAIASLVLRPTAMELDAICQVVALIRSDIQ